MKSVVPRYPVDRYLVESSKKFELVSLIDDDIWNPEPALRPEDEMILRKLHDMLQSTADDLKLLSGELAKFHEPGIQVKSTPTPLDEEFNEKVHIEEVVNAKFHGHKIVEKPLHVPIVKKQNDTIDRVKVNQTTKINTKIGTNAPSVLRTPVINKNLRVSRTRTMQINGNNLSKINNETLTNGKIINKAPKVAYKEFAFKYVEPKVTENTKKPLKVQNLPSINIRSELKEQKVFQLNIVPENIETKEADMVRSNVSVVAMTHETVPKHSPIKLNKPVQVQNTSWNNLTKRKVSKMSTFESSESTNNIDSDTRTKQSTQKRIISAMKNPPKTSARARATNNITATVKKETGKYPRLNVDEWRKKLNVVYKSSNSKKNKVLHKKSPKMSNVTKKPVALNNAEYIPYAHLTLGGVRVSYIEREISDLPSKTDMPLSPILDKILTSRENSFHKESPRKCRLKDSPNPILTTSDENLLQEVIDIERSVNKTLTKNLKKKVNEPIVSSHKSSDAEENDNYADDFEDDKSDHNEEPNNQILSTDEETDKHFYEKADASSDNDDNDASYGEYNPGPSNVKNTTYTKTSNLSLKDSVDIFEFVHFVETHDTATQSNGTNKITPKETQTSPHNENPQIQPIHNDLWPSIDPRREVEKMFELEKDLIKRLIIDEYGDLLEKNINKPATSNENQQEETRINVTASQKNTQTSPAHVKSVMTSPRRTKTRTTSPFHLSVPAEQQTSPMVLITNTEEQRNDIEVEADDISVNLSSPRFSLRLPQNSREVLHNLEDQSRPHSKRSLKQHYYNKTYTKTTASSSSSVDADNYSSDISSLGEVKIKRRPKNKACSTSENSTSSTVSNHSYVQSTGILPLKSEGEVSLEQVAKKTLPKHTKSDGETSLGPLK